MSHKKIEEFAIPSIKQKGEMLTVKVLETGEVHFLWSRDEKIVDHVDFCANAFFKVISGIPKLFNSHEPLFYSSCERDTTLVMVHDTEFPEIALGIMKQDQDRPQSLVVTERGRIITVLDHIGYILASLESVMVCDDSEHDQEDDGDDNDDPFDTLTTIH